MDTVSKKYITVVIGGGHAGVEAAAASARLGVSTILVTLRRSAIGEMSCNPAIGGVGKGQLVREVDALGGVMGEAIDRGGIQFRTLNSSKGAAVRASRAQADRKLYKEAVLSLVSAQPNLTVIEGEVAGIEITRGVVRGVLLRDGSRIEANCVVVTTGTFLRGVMHTGAEQTRGGRRGDVAAESLSESLCHLGFELGRLKTGTPPRIRRSSIRFDGLVEQPGEKPPRPFSIRTEAITQPQVSCWLTATNEQVHDIIRANRARSPLFNGQISSGGPRYCPSIEDKVYRFADKGKHTIFLEPEGYDCDVVYPNGISTSLPVDVQEAFVRSIAGLEDCEILQPGYAVEYDFVNPIALTPTLETKLVRGLFFAGQINGTSGYEEAAAQGLIAGANTALKLLEREPLVLGRSDAYIGVMIDDLITNGVDEPYRMFTSRAEFRLVLREDNAAARLTPLARDRGLIGDGQWKKFQHHREIRERMRAWCEETRLNPTDENNRWLASMSSAALRDSIAISTLARRPELSLGDIFEHASPPMEVSPEIHSGLEIELKFEGYLARQLDEVRKLEKLDKRTIPADFPYDDIPSLRIEAREKLKRHRPYSLGQAMRIPGITPTAISLLAVYLERHKRSVPGDLPGEAP